MTPTVPPVVLEADASSFFPEDAQTPGVLKMLAPDGDIERMLERIKAQMGITLPAMQLLSGPSLGPGRYNVILDGSIAGEFGRLGSESSLRSGSRGVPPPRSRRPRRRHPLEESGPGGLCSRRGRRSTEELEVLDRYQYMLRHVEAVLLRNLDLFYGNPAGSGCVRSRQKGRDAGVAGAHGRGLARALARGRALDRREVDCGRSHEAGRGRHRAACTRRTSPRAACAGAPGCGRLPPARIGSPRPRRCDRAVDQRRDGKEFVALPGAKLAELRSLVDEQVASLEPGASLVVRPHGLRRFVRRSSSRSSNRCRSRFHRARRTSS